MAFAMFLTDLTFWVGLVHQVVHALESRFDGDLSLPLYPAFR